MDQHPKRSGPYEQRSLIGEGMGAAPQNVDRAACRRAILQILPHLRIAHHLPGRIRLQLKPGRLSLAAVGKKDAAAAISSLRQLLPGIHELRLNRIAGSVLLEYRASLYPYRLVDALFRNDDAVRAEFLLDAICNLTEPPEGESYE